LAFKGLDPKQVARGRGAIPADNKRRFPKDAPLAMVLAGWCVTLLLV
jgi:hypothetical protein